MDLWRWCDLLSRDVSSEARALLADDRVQLANALINADPLHNKHDTIQVILQKGGDYLVGTKENISRRLKGANHALKDAPFFK
jgi:hypothetical protein